MEMIKRVTDFNKYFDTIRQHENIVCYGAGSKGRQTVEILRERNIFPTAFVDGDEKRWGGDCAGLPVIGYEELTEKYEKYCILITCVYDNAKEIHDLLKEKGENNPVYYVCNPYKAENKFLSMEEIEHYREELQITYDAMEDDKSREILIRFLNWKGTGDMSGLVNYTEGNWLEFFGTELLPKFDDYVYMDVGAYTGDTIIRFLSFCGGKYKKIIAFEPDEANCLEAERVIRAGRLENVELLPTGLWMCKEEKQFFAAGNGKVYESSNLYRDVANTISVRNEVAANVTARSIVVDTLDSQIKSLTGRAILKVDALASEVPILYGAERLIKECRPIIIMEYGTYSKYMAETIPYLRRLHSDYKFYLRQMWTFHNSRTILYVV